MSANLTDLTNLKLDSVQMNEFCDVQQISCLGGVLT